MRLAGYTISGVKRCGNDARKIRLTGASSSPSLEGPATGTLGAELSIE